MTQIEATLAPIAPATSNTTLFDRIWPAAVIILGLGLNIAWVAFLGYGLVSIIGIAF